MFNSLLIWSPFIFIFLLAFLSSTSAFSHTPSALGPVGALILLPAAISTLFLFKLTYESWIILGSNWRIVPLDLRVLFSRQSALLLGAITLALIITLFLLPNSKTVNTIKLLSTTCLLWSLMTLPVNWFIFMSIFSIGSIIIHYQTVNEADLISPDSDRGSLFLSQRIGDLLAFSSLCFILAHEKTLSVLVLPALASQIPQASTVIFFLALIARLAPLSRKRTSFSFAQFRAFYLEDCFVAIGILIICLRLKEVIFYYSNANYLLMISCVLIFLRAAFVVPLRRLDIFMPLNALMPCAALILMCFGKFSGAEFILYAQVLLIPIALNVAAHQDYFPRAQKGPEASFDPLGHLASLLTRVLNFSSQALVQYISPFYTNFILYRLPQLLISILQIPLRLFNNGNIKRSLLFIMVSLAAYYWWWG